MKKTSRKDINNKAMMDINIWTNEFLSALDKTFENRVWFVGLQGSYGRGEATESSDIDMVVILDELTVADIESYNKMLDSLPNRELVCGFLSGKKEILHWDTSDLFQFYYDTKAIKGCLDELLPLIDDTAIDRAIKIGSCNIYHGCVHNMLYEKNTDILKGLYKSASFVIQAVNFQKTKKYTTSQKDLLCVASEEDAKILKTYLDMKNGVDSIFDEMSEALFIWAKKKISGSVI